MRPPIYEACLGLTPGRPANQFSWPPGMGNEEAEAAQHRNVVVMCKDPCSGRCLLCHLWTQEQVALPPGDWALEFDSDGFGYVSLSADEGTMDVDGEGPHEEPQWVDSLLTMSVYMTKSGKRYLLQRSQGEEVLGPLDQELESFTRLVLRIAFGNSQARCEQHVAVWSLPLSGSRLAWRLTDLHSIVGFSVHLKKDAARWVYRRWSAFSAFLKSIGCPLGILRSATRDDEGHDGPPPQVDRRVLPFVSCPTYAFLALLGRLAWSRHRMTNAELQQGVADFCVSILRAYDKVESASVRWSFDRESVWHPPMLLQGRCQVVCEMARGRLNLSPVAKFISSAACTGATRTIALRLASALGDLAEIEMPLMEVFQCLAKSCCDDHDIGILFGQLCFSAAEVLESTLLPPDTPAKQLPTKHLVCRDRMSWESCGGSDTSHERDLKLARYLRVSALACEGAEVMSISVDASRIGKKSLFLGCAALGSNLAFWMPPQAIRLIVFVRRLRYRAIPAVEVFVRKSFEVPWARGASADV